MTRTVLRKYGFLIVGDRMTVSVPAQWSDENEARQAADADLALWVKAGPNAKLIIVDDRSAETVEFLKSKGKDYTWLMRM